MQPRTAHGSEAKTGGGGDALVQKKIAVELVRWPGLLPDYRHDEAEELRKHGRKHDGEHHEKKRSPHFVRDVLFDVAVFLCSDTLCERPVAATHSLVTLLHCKRSHIMQTVYR